MIAQSNTFNHKTITVSCSQKRTLEQLTSNSPYHHTLKQLDRVRYIQLLQVYLYTSLRHVIYKYDNPRQKHIIKKTIHHLVTMVSWDYIQ